MRTTHLCACIVLLLLLEIVGLCGCIRAIGVCIGVTRWDDITYNNNNNNNNSRILHLLAGFVPDDARTILSECAGAVWLSIFAMLATRYACSCVIFALGYLGLGCFVWRPMGGGPAGMLECYRGQTLSSTPPKA